MFKTSHSYTDVQYTILHDFWHENDFDLHQLVITVAILLFCIVVNLFLKKQISQC